MWIVRLALNRPYTFVVLALLIFMAAPMMLLRAPVDIFPQINIPVVSVIWTYTGLVPSEMDRRITSIYERALTTTVANVQHIESQSLNGVAVIKIYLQPQANVDGAIAQVVAEAQATLKQLPPGINPPLVIQYSASTVPIIQLGLSGRGLSEQQLNDLGTNFIRPQLATIRGAAVPLPYGGKVRQVMVDIDSSKLEAEGLAPLDVVNAVNAQNVILPSGTAKIGATEYNVGLNGTPTTMGELNGIPVKTANGGTVFLKDVAHVRDGFAVQQNIVRQDGHRGALLTVEKTGSASTLTIVSAVRAALPRIAAGLSPDLKITPLADQSVFVRAALDGVVREGLIAACLTSIMILVFLGSWRSTMIICVSIPLSILTSLLLLSALGESINVMTLGGLALAVGVLVDDATVEIENMQRNVAMGKELRQAILDSAQEIARPAFLATTCISIVFVPMFFLTGVSRYLFAPLAEAVVFSLFASYFFSRTIIPTLVMYLLPKEVARNKQHEQGQSEPGWFDRLHGRFEHAFESIQHKYERLLSQCIECRKAFICLFLVFCLGSVVLLPFLGEDFFPSVDAGEFHLHVRAKTGTRLEDTARLVDEVDRYIRTRIPPNEISGILDNIGLPTSGINLSYSNSGTVGEMDADILGSLEPKHHPTVDYVAELRSELPKRFPGTSFFFEPADIASQTLNFGIPAPLDIQIVGSNVNANFALASRLAEQIKHVPGAVDVHIEQLEDQPRLQYDVDRVRVQQLGLAERDVASNVLISLSSSFQTQPNFWLNPINGVSYNIAVQTPQYRVNSLDAIDRIPVNVPGSPKTQLLRNLASMTPQEEPAIVTHYDVAPVIDIYGSVQGRDLGGVSADIAKITDQAKEHLPRGATLVTRGQVATMRSSFKGLYVGLAIAVLLVYLLLVVNFQSWTEAFIIITALPGALAGICWILLLTHTTLSVPALMGTIMCIGVATSNSVLVITFANEHFAESKDALRAALEAGATRLRPVLMTAMAMIIGMIPMALGLGDGGEQNAPLGRAVIGGLMFATVATLFFVPIIFYIIRNRTNRSSNSEVEHAA
ncbi:efflux RND transporter permease subunit [Edaphobacter sp. HDX4]|uniref:efflux RND transporter permease subunit n=1 Tax=Edaphobacter sp. HDX4 TaxID=2794064 RepID=UPI002FE5F004